MEQLWDISTVVNMGILFLFPINDINMHQAFLITSYLNLQLYIHLEHEYSLCQLSLETYLA